MNQVVDLAFEFDDGTDPERATQEVLDLLRSLPGDMEVDAEPALPMAVDLNQAVLTVLAIIGVAKVTVWQLDELTTDLRKFVKNLRGLRRVMLRTGDEVREIVPRDGEDE
ncbi:hypothetical protein AB0F88_38625 [Streptosporangium sp. NPDC023963]|uniref:hypothetical protein n=1 Tax=Streptosporangium sp. NPDC023963 TaxID=3155608 RepID=UPI0034311D40